MLKKFHRKIKSENELGARRAVLEDLFYDFNSSRAQIYRTNFVRGLFFGLGSVLGGTVLIALVAWFLTFFISVPGIGDGIKQVQTSIENKN